MISKSDNQNILAKAVKYFPYSERFKGNLSFLWGSVQHSF